MCNLVDNPPVKQRRERKHECRYRFCRKVKGRSYQSRLWLQDIGSINLGCYRSEWEAGMAAKAFVHRYQPGVHLCEVLDSLRGDGSIPQHVCAKFVAKAPNGIGFIAKVKKHGKKIHLGPFTTEREAHNAMMARVERMSRAAKRSPRYGRTSPYIAVTSAARKLGISINKFRQHWQGVFSRPLDCRQVVYRDELGVAMEAGGFTSDVAKEAVVIFRMGIGRLNRDSTLQCKKLDHTHPVESRLSS